MKKIFLIILLFQLTAKAQTENPIIQPLQDYVNRIDELGWVSDTIWLNKNSKKDRIGFSVFNNKPYYFINPYGVMNVQDYLDLYDDKETIFDSKLFNEAKSVWCYYYRKNDRTYMVSDGVIKQWEFNNEEDSRRALKNLEEVYPFPFFNTMPEYFVYKNYLIVFSTRDNRFSVEQKPIYDLFGKMLDNFIKE